MSTVVGIVNSRGVWIGGDSAATTEDGEKRPVIAEKIFRNGEYLFGHIGGVRGGQLLRKVFYSPPNDIRILAESIRLHLKDFSCIALSVENQTEIHTSNFLVGFQGKLYEILTDFQMNQIPEYDAIGSGSSFAFGALYILRKEKITPEQKIKLALETAAQFDAATGPPFVIEKL